MDAVDTNILLYACDRSDKRKNAIAQQVIRDTAGGALLWQVAVEFVAASRKLTAIGFTPTMAWDRWRGLAKVYRFISPGQTALRQAQRLQLDKQWSFWDALIAGACIEAGVTRLYSEDLPGSVPDELQIINPFVQ